MSIDFTNISLEAHKALLEKMKNLPAQDAVPDKPVQVVHPAKVVYLDTVPPEFTQPHDRLFNV